MYQLIQLILQNLTFFALHLKNLTSFPKPLSAKRETELLHKMKNQLKVLRKELCMTQRQFADMVGVPVGNLKLWEPDRCVIRYESFIKTKRFLSIIQFLMSYNYKQIVNTISQRKKIIP